LIKLESASAPSLQFNVTNPTCNNVADGIIDMTINGGTAPYNVKWLRGDVSEDISNVQGGGYFVEVNDDRLCVTFECVSVINPSPIKITAIENNPTACAAADGSIVASANGGTGIPYTYTWSNSTIGASNLTLAADVYQVTVQDQNNCTASKTFGLTDISGITIRLDSVSNTTCGTNVGAIFTSIKDATNPSFIWSNGDTTEDILNLDNGSYSLKVVDGNCIASLVIEVTEAKPAALEICMVTVDDSTGHNLLVFDKTAADASVTSFNVYRESCKTDEFLFIGSVSAADPSLFEDVNSGPKQKSWKYKMSTMDQ
jgi:hypothetical protein